MFSMLKRKKLEELFKQFPGIGPKQARRFVFALLYKNPQYINKLSSLIKDIRQETKQCKDCNRFFENSESVDNICNICSDSKRNQEKILILNTNQDFENIISNRIWGGGFFLVGGNLKLTEKNPETKIRLNALVEKIKNKKIEEITFALSLNPEGEHTKNYIKSILEPLQKKYNFKMLELGRGLSLGAEIEYTDQITLKEAFKHRV